MIRLYLVILGYVKEEQASGKTEQFSYDLNGNISQRVTPTITCNYGWDEENRLRSFTKKNKLGETTHLHYYDASGERIIKVKGTTAKLFQDADLTSAQLLLRDFTVYPSAFITQSDSKITKHYYAGTKRIASRIEMKTAFEPGISIDTELKLKQETDLETIAKTLDCKEYKYEFNQFEAEADDEDTASLMAADPTPIFYYHPDHLGSSTVISNSAGAVHQYFFNLPFGETMIEGCTNSTYELNYKFNAKELDAESGMYYYGARYYDPRISVWMSVDPMAKKRSWLSSYNYCQNNPVIRIDPTGALNSDHIDEFGNTIAHYDDGDNSVYVHKYGTTKSQVDAQRKESNNTSGNGTRIGEVGGNIDVSSIMTNKLAVSREVAKKLDGLGDFANMVKAGSIWDLENNKETIFGVAWEYDASHNTSTTFNFGDYLKMTAADIGNYHFGYVGRYTNNGKGFNESTLWIAAGLVEIKKNILNEGRIFLGLSRMTQLFGLAAPKPPFGDRMEDFIWSTSGMLDADKSKNH